MPTFIEQLEERRADIARRLKSIATHAEATNDGNFTDEELAQVNELKGEYLTLGAEVDRYKSLAATKAEVDKFMAGSDSNPRTGTGAAKAASRASRAPTPLGRDIARALFGPKAQGDYNPSGLLSQRHTGRRFTDADGYDHLPKASALNVKAGLTSVPTLRTTDDRSVFLLPENGARIVPLLSQVDMTSGADYSFWAQTGRDDMAAQFVPPKQPKASTEFEYAKTVDHVRTVAVLSDPIPLQDLQDVPDLRDDVGGELARRVIRRIDWAVINGDDAATTDDQFDGVLNVEGVQDVAYATDALTTLRKALTVLQNDAFTPTAYAVNPTDWEAVELLRDTQGRLLYASSFAVGVQPMLFGVPVVIADVVPAGTAILADWRAGVLAERGQMDVSWSDGGDLFETNTVRFRSETRIGFNITQPTAFVVAHLTGTGG
ncbi:phage major capsid protein [Cellulomonas alba]|uniref:Phage major capsid protein n=1 Tax=Cellulomonas alba TaxID=3053467 RepID=A0ABT7SKB2_9CELL|nr:phage major capsid protein [Cellulomonas alba]MDM7856628.1 phage major capsid protein [Cellulomonas alba]